MFIFTPWRKFLAFKDYAARWSFVRDVADTGETIFREKILNPPKTGKMYGSHQASRGGEFPANRSGALQKSVDSTARLHRVDIGSGMFYSIFLREGTSKMKPRKMSQDVLPMAISEARSRAKPHTRFRFD